ncbi:hypothetical protein [Burkholderia gladioli]|uniref:AbiTii domain-containing protein n=1 Tax=Burkholderia gladioli TaxID=28095 RepID=UPI0016418AD3|nr:hypothetical protein [Burkholderia gladioli]
MKLLDDIVDLLSDKNGSLTGALLKTKVLLHRIGHRELVEWVGPAPAKTGHGVTLKL